MSMEDVVETISEMATDMKEGVYVSEGKVWDEDEKHEEVLITDKAKLLLCSERCMRKEHYGILYTLSDGDMIFVCNFARERDTHPISLVLGQLERATRDYKGYGTYDLPHAEQDRADEGYGTYDLP